jgi:hypothetical protein
MAALYSPETNTLHFHGMTVTIQPTPKEKLQAENSSFVGAVALSSL